MIHWRSIGFWPGAALGATLGVVFGLGTLMAERSAHRQVMATPHTVPSPSHVRAADRAPSTALPTAADLEPTPPCVCADTGDAAATQLALRLAQATDSTFEQLLIGRVLASYSNLLGSCCGPVIKYEATGHLLAAADVQPEPFSELTDVFPGSTGQLFSRNSVHFSDLYERLLDLAQMRPGAWDVDFLRTKAAAQRALDLNQLASAEGPFRYALALPRPRDWFTDKAYWSAYHMDHGPAPQRTDSSTHPAARPQLAFDYCIVGIDRPWFSEALFRSHHRWCIPEMIQDQFAQQHDLRLVPVAMVVVRNVVLTLKGSSTPLPDPRSITLPPFTLLNGNWSRTEDQLTNTSTQAVAWICAPLPPLPPASYPGALPVIADLQ